VLNVPWKRPGRSRSLPSGVISLPGRRWLAAPTSHATHPVNAMLNYAYSVLERQVRIVTVRHGLDLMVGYLHVCRPGRVALVYDLMEPLRPRVDRLVLHFVRSHPFSPGDLGGTLRCV
jgi:CRISP-associated protein Cas1